MKRQWLAGGLVLLLISSSLRADNLELIKTIPHSGYSEGIDFHEGFLWHSLPKKILKIDPKDGTAVTEFTPPSEYAESLCWFQGKLWNLSFHDNGIYAGKLTNGKLTFERVGTTPEDHGWGITHDGKNLIITGNFSRNLYYLDPKTLQVVRKVVTPISDLEDLAWDGKGIWASSFKSHRGQIFRINPVTGEIDAMFSLPKPEECPVIDGLAYDGKGLWIVGKDCPSFQYVKLPTERVISSQKKSLAITK